MIGRERVGAFYFEHNNLGVAIFTQQTMRIQCSRVNSICRVLYPQLAAIAHPCSTILTNIPHHDIFGQLDIAQTAVIEVQKPIQTGITEHNLSKVTGHVASLKNPTAYFKKMGESKMKFNALGMLLHHLFSQAREVKLYLEDIDFFTDTLLQLVSVGEEQLRFLEITHEDLHPSLIKGKGHSKEGYSLISAYESYLASKASKRILRSLLLNPTYNKSTLEQRQTLIEWTRHHLRDQHFGKHFRNVHLMEGVLKKFGRMNAEEDDWRKLMKTLEAMIDVAALLRLPDPPELIERYIQDRHWSELIELYSIFKETFEFSPLGIRNGIDQTLDQLKQTYDNMPHMLTLIAKEQHWQLDFRIVFLTQVGYLVKLSPQVSLPHGFDDWELQFSNNSGRFYSNQLTEALDRQYGDIFGEIQDIEKKITFDMQALVVQRQEVILGLYWQLCEIECYWGVAQVSRSMCRPKISSEGLILANAWHPLLSGEVIKNHAFSFPQSQAPRERVCNSERNLVHTEYSNRCVILTGPNASGKTVYMKQLALAVYLAHAGFFVPATLAEILLIDSLLFVGKATSIYNEQSCGFHSELASLSALTQPYVLSNKSLVLIDELGSEIDYQTSLKLMYATVEHLTTSTSFVKNRILAKEDDEFPTPLVVIVTHLSEILNNRVIQENYRVRFLTMMVEQEGICLYKVRPGLVARGYGLRAASHIMPAEFIALSEKYLQFIEEN